MTFDAFESSDELSTPVELFIFTLGAEQFLYTSAEDDITISLPNPINGVYESIPIERSAIQQSADENRTDSIEITLPSNNELAAKYVGIVPGKPLELDLYRFHRLDAPDPETILSFQGVMQTVSFVEDGRVAKLQVQSLTKAKNRQIPRFTYQGPCNHMLYDVRCKISDTDPSFEKFLTCGSIDATGTFLTVTGAGAFGADFFEAGFIEFDNDFRTVKSQSGDVLEIFIPFITDPTSSQLRCLAGCKLRLVEDCRDKFNNVVNYGGFAWVPTKNPFRTGLDPLLPSTP